MHILLFFILIALIFPGLIRFLLSLVGLTIICLIIIVATAHATTMRDALDYCQSDDVDANYAMAGHHRLTDKQCARRVLRADKDGKDKNTVREPCSDLVNQGLAHMPYVTDYVLAKPGADKLGFDSECYIDNLVFAQCWLEPKITVKQAIDLLLTKARAGKKLPDTPACGA